MRLRKWRLILLSPLLIVLVLLFVVASVVVMASEAIWKGVTDEQRDG